MESKTITNHLTILTILPEISFKTLSLARAYANHRSKSKRRKTHSMRFRAKL